MKRFTSRNCLLLVCILLSPSLLIGQSFLDEKKLNAELDRLLKTRDISDVANELAGKKASPVRDELKAITIFARAGQTARVTERIAALGSTSLPTEHPDRYHLNRIVRNAIAPDDLIAQRVYYERFAPVDERTGEFVDLWLKTGDVKDLESWLTPRARANDTWWEHLYQVKVSLGTVDELIDDLVAELRTNPTDVYRMQKYLRVAGRSHDVSWLLEVGPSDSSYWSYELGLMISPYARELAIQVLEKSLRLPFTAADRTLFAERAFRTASISPTVNNAEKQLRYWTMQLIARLQKEAGRPELAQPYVEKLTAMDVSDIQTDDSYRLAGGVQAASGQRVVESRILQGEATGREQPEYWIERANYYRGRQEPDSVLASYKQGLDVFPYSKAGGNEKRLYLLHGLADLYGFARKAEVKAILRAELNRSERDPGFQFMLSRGLLSYHEDVVADYFVNTGRLPHVLDSRAEWRQDEESVMGEMLDRKAWDSAKHDAVLRDFIRLARGKTRERAFALATVLMEIDAYRQAIPLLEECRKVAGDEYTSETHFTREDVDRKLFDAHIAIGDWQRAKTMYDRGYAYWGDELSQIAVAAAKSGDSINALRFWEVNANRDRRKLNGLDTLSGTGAKPLLRAFYLSMKARDPQSWVPDKALSILN